MICDQGQENEPVVKIDTDSISTPCTPRALVYSNKGCPTLKVLPLFEWLDGAKYVMGPIAGILGVYFMILSLYFYKQTCYMIGFTSTPILLVGALYALVISIDSPTWIVTFPVIIASFIGLAVGGFTMKYTVLAKVLAGVFGGWVVHSFLFMYFTHRFNDYTAATTIFWCMIIAMKSIGGIIGGAFFPMSFIISTSFAGSYLFFRCIAVFAGGFTNEFLVVKERDEGRYDHIAWQNYLYLAFILVLGVVATFVQYRMNKLKYYDKSDSEKKGFNRI